MSGIRHPRRTLRSIGALFAGFVVVVVLSEGTDAVLRAAGLFPARALAMSDALFALAAVYRCIYSVIGCYLTARLAPDRPSQAPAAPTSWSLQASMRSAARR